jgi:hypothetical protein
MSWPAGPGNGSHVIYCGDCLDQLTRLEAESA